MKLDQMSDAEKLAMWIITEYTNLPIDPTYRALAEKIDALCQTAISMERGRCKLVLADQGIDASILDRRGI